MQAALYRLVLRETRTLVRAAAAKGLVSPLRLPLILPSKGVHPPWGQGYSHAGDFDLSTLAPTVLALTLSKSGDAEEAVPLLVEAWLAWNELVGDEAASRPSALADFARACWGRRGAVADREADSAWRAWLEEHALGEAAAFDGLAVLGEQIGLVERSSARTTQGVRVECTSQFLHMSADGPLHCYRVVIVNETAPRCQLLSRHWRKVEFFDPIDAVRRFVAERRRRASPARAHPSLPPLPSFQVGMSHSHLASHLAAAAAVECSEGEDIVPRGAPGVVGHTPTLARGEGFTYMSGAASGAARVVGMHGSFEMETLVDDGAAEDGAGDAAERRFDALIAPFPLVAPTERERE